MIRIAVCDDDTCITQSIHDFLKVKDEQFENERLDISLYHSGEDLLKDIELGNVFHIILIDIQMGGINGVEVGERIRSKPNGDDIIMIYMSYHNGYFENLVKIGSFSFVWKPIDNAELEDVFIRALGQAIKYKDALYKPNRFSYKCGVETQSVITDRIVYMKNKAHVIEMYLWDNKKKSAVLFSMFYEKLENVIERLPKDQFCRCEQSHIVNFSYVDMMVKEAFILSYRIEGKPAKVPISRRFYKETAKAFFNYKESLT